MDLTTALILAGFAFLMLIGCGFAQSRRRLSGWSLIPWDYAMILAAVLLIVFLAQAALQWRDSLL